MVYISVFFSLVWSLALAGVCFAAGAVPMGVILLVLTLITAVMFWWIRAQLYSCAKLLSVAGMSPS